MSVTELLKSNGFRSHGTVTNSWDAFREDGTVLMQLWTGPDQRIHNHAIEGAYLRVRCLDALRHSENAQRQAVGYAGRLRAIKALEEKTTGYAALSSPPGDKHGPGLWAKHANLSRVYPVLATEHEPNGDVFVILGKPLAIESIKLGATSSDA